MGKCRGKITYLIAFFLPVLVYVITLAVNNSVPFGRNWLSGADFDSQYVAFYAELIRKINSGESLLYTFNAGMGTNFVALAAYYLISPLNVLLCLFKPHQADVAVITLIIIKVGFCGLNAYIYLKNKYNSRYAIVFSSVYALSMYFIVKGYNIMWLDSVALFPLVILGLEKLYKEKKVVLYTVSLGLAILCNYYIGYMICLFCVMYFIYLLTCEKRYEIIWKSVGRFALYSLLAGCMAMIIIIPELYALSDSFTVQSEVLSDKLMGFHWYRMITGMLFGDKIGTVTYCTLGIFILSIVYIGTKSIPLRQRIGKAVLCVVLLLSFWLKPLDIIWNGFHTVHNAQGTRYVFIFVFLIVTMAYETFVSIEKTKEINKNMILVAGLVLLLGIYMLNWHYKGSKFIFDDVLLNVCVGVLYIGILYAFIKYREKVKPGIIAITIILELIFSVLQNYQVNLSYTDLCQDIYNGEEKFVRTVDMDKTGDYMNEGMLFGYKSMSIYSSIVYDSQYKLFDKMYGKNTINRIEYDGNDEIGNMLFSVKYIYKAGEKIENRYFLPLGYYVGNDVKDLFRGNDYEEIRRNFLCKTTGNKDIDIEEAYKILSNNTFNMKENKISQISGDIELDEAGYVFFSIPYDKGWSLTVNGREQTIENIDNTYIYIHLEEGVSELSLEYFPRGLKLGTVISTASLLIFVLLVIKNKRNIHKE
ncbi:MAG: YfhO family protein [Lachnospiraceae bacterium]|nr:YfhO family protein [Lachnospiraceae bacterium]